MDAGDAGGHAVAMLHRASLAVAVALLGCTLRSQDAAAPLQDLAELLVPIRVKHDVPALGAAVIVDGKLVALGVDGIRRVGHEEKVTVDDRWHLGSCTKAMTATLLARYVERGQLAWTTKVADGLPDLAAGMYDEAKGITLQQLLAHRSSLAGGPPGKLWGRLFDYGGSDAAARTEVAATMLAKAPSKPPGERFLYSNAGYMVAGAMLERLPALAADASKPDAGKPDAGKPDVANTATSGDWAARMQRELFAPLGIASAGFGMPGSKDTTTQPWGHTGKGKACEAQSGDNPSSLGPAGTTHMTLRDWAKFAALHLGVQPEPALLRAESLQALHTPWPGGDYALGWAITKRPWAPGPIVTHNGSNTMWFCVAWLAPEAKFAVLVTCNHGDGGAACDAVAAACIQRFRPAAK